MRMPGPPLPALLSGPLGRGAARAAQWPSPSCRTCYSLRRGSLAPAAPTVLGGHTCTTELLAVVELRHLLHMGDLLHTGTCYKWETCYRQAHSESSPPCGTPGRCPGHTGTWWSGYSGGTGRGGGEYQGRLWHTLAVRVWSQVTRFTTKFLGIWRVTQVTCR